MRDKNIRNHILFRVFIIPVFLILAVSSVSAESYLYQQTGVSENNSGMVCIKGANSYFHVSRNLAERKPWMNGINIKTDILLGWAVSLAETSYYRSRPVPAFSTISVSMGSSLNNVFKKLKRMLSGISKFF
jgi:hypothetical protein